MLGFYDNFPKSVHNIFDFSTLSTLKKLQTTMVETLYKLNNQTFALEEVTTPSTPECRVTFEFGIADDKDFNYLNTEEKDKLLKTIQKRPFSILDYFCIVRYYTMKMEKKTTLKSDHYMLRFLFEKEFVQIQIFHEKGLMYTTPKDLPEFLAGRINAESTKKLLKPL
jgi:hypothetical protein